MSNPYNVWLRDPTTLASGNPYSLVATVGAFTLSGQSSQLLWGHLQPADVTTFALNGVSAATLYGPKVVTSVGTFTLAGVAANLRKTSILATAVGPFTLSGQAVVLKVGHRVAPDTGVYILNGVAATLTYTPVGGYTLPVTVGVFSLSGQPANLYHNDVLDDGIGTFVLSGLATGLQVGYRLSASVGTFVVNGLPVILDYRTLPTRIGGDDAPKKRRKRRKSANEELAELLQRVTEPAPKVLTARKGKPVTAHSPAPVMESEMLPSDALAAAIEEDDEEVLLALS